MRTNRVLALTAALTLGSAVSLLSVQVASAQSVSTQVVVPSAGATVSGTQVVLDATASTGVTKVRFEVSGGSLSNFVIGTATPTIYGWIARWNSTTVVNGTYTLQSIATSGGSSGTSTGISIMVNNGGQTMSFVLPHPNGGTVSGTQAVLDAVGPAGVTGVTFAYSTTGCPSSGPSQPPLCTLSATLTIYGWIALWNSTEVPNGNYELFAGCTGCGIAMTSMDVANPAAAVVVPVNGAMVSGSQVLDCVPPTGYGSVQFWIGSASMTGSQLLGDATSTSNGWLYDWGTSSVANGPYTIYCTAGSPSTGATAFSPTILVTVAN